MGLGMRMSMKTRMRRMKMSDFLLRFSWVLFRPVGFCCRRPGFWAGLVLDGLVLDGLVLDGLVLG